MPDHLDPLSDGAFVGCGPMCGVGNEPLLHLDDQRRLRGRKTSIVYAFHPVTAFHAFAAAPRGTIRPSRKGPQLTTTPTDTPKLNEQMEGSRDG